jgi:aminoglycoside/choline kinase family phosphotransferase
MHSDIRLQSLKTWLQEQLHPQIFTLEMLAGDASFRRYFRVRHQQQTYIAMDAPPEKENCQPYIAMTEVLKSKGLDVPHILRKDEIRGYLLLTDLGDDLYFRILTQETAEQLYKNALRDLLIIQSCKQNDRYFFPLFDDRMIEELQRFREWYLEKHLNLKLTVKEEHLLNDTFTKLIHSAVHQPQVCVHRDFHSRNLLALPQQKVGILDFQDAVWGPITYDLVSLLRDCYIAWPTENVIAWAKNYFSLCRETKLLNISEAQFFHWFDWMGIQRHLKAIYIFSRKFHRDQNANYLHDIPRTLNYVLQVTENYLEFKEFRKFLLSRAFDRNLSL